MLIHLLNFSKGLIDFLSGYDKFLQRLFGIDSILFFFLLTDYWCNVIFG